MSRAGDRGGSDLLALSTSDLDGDGKPEIVAVGRRHVAWVRRSGGDLFGAVLDPTLACHVGCDSLAIGDIDGDGQSETVVSGSGTVTSITTSHGPADLGSAVGPRLVALADVDGDGASDLVIVGPEGAQVYTQSLSSQRTLASPLLRPSSVDAGDLDGDGRADVVAADPEGDRCRVPAKGRAPLGHPGSPPRCAAPTSRDAARDLVTAPSDGRRLLRDVNALEVSVWPALLAVGYSMARHLDVTRSPASPTSLTTFPRRHGRPRAHDSDELCRPAGALASPISTATASTSSRAHPSHGAASRASSAPTTPSLFAVTRNASPSPS